MPFLFSPAVTVAMDVAAWAAIHATTGYLVHRMHVSRFDRDWWIHRARRFERDGRPYERVVRIKRWKHLLPEAGALFAGGFDKRSLGGRDRASLEAYVRETRRAELGHWLCASGAPLFVVWNPWPVAIVMVVYAAAANGPCILATRYNRLRLERVLRSNRSVSGNARPG